MGGAIMGSHKGKLWALYIGTNWLNLCLLAVTVKLKCYVTLAFKSFSCVNHRFIQLEWQWNYQWFPHKYPHSILTLYSFNCAPLPYGPKNMWNLIRRQDDWDNIARYMTTFSGISFKLLMWFNYPLVLVFILFQCYVYI